MADGELVGVLDVAEPTTPDGADEHAARDLMWRALGALEPRQRAMLVLRYYLALPDQAIIKMVWSAQVAGHAPAAPSATLDLVNFERQQARLQIVKTF